MASSSQAPTATEYIVHHLTHLSTAKQGFIVDFSVFNVDTIFFSVVCLLLTLWMLRAAAKRATAGVPTKFQAAIELLVEMVEEQSKSIVHGDRREPTWACFSWASSSRSARRSRFWR